MNSESPSVRSCIQDPPYLGSVEATNSSLNRDSADDRLFTVEYLGNMVEGGKTLYINLPVELLKKFAANSIKAGEAVWFGCDVGKLFAGKPGIQVRLTGSRGGENLVPWGGVSLHCVGGRE